MGKLKVKGNNKRQDAHKKILSDTYAAAERFQAYKPSPLKNLRQNEYKDNLPDVPKAPKLPKLTTPGGNLTKTAIPNPSGLKGTSSKYSSKPDYSNVYKNTQRKGPPKDIQQSLKHLGPVSKKSKSTNEVSSQGGPSDKTQSSADAFGLPSTTGDGPRVKTPEKSSSFPKSGTREGSPLAPEKSSSFPPSKAVGGRIPGKVLGPVDSTNQGLSKGFKRPTSSGKGVQAPDDKKNIKLQVRDAMKDGTITSDWSKLQKAAKKAGLPENFVQKSAAKQFKNLEKHGKLNQQLSSNPNNVAERRANRRRERAVTGNQTAWIPGYLSPELAAKRKDKRKANKAWSSYLN